MSGPSSLAVLHGATLKGRPCTLFDPLLQERTGELFSGHSQERWLSNLLFHGAHVSNLADFSFRRARVGLRGLAEWLNEPWSDADPRSFKGIAKEGIVEIQLNGARLLFQEGETTKTEAFSKHTEVDFTALFEFDDPITFPDLHDRFIRPLHDLLILGTNEEIHVEEITLLIPEDVEKWWGDKEPIKHVNEVAVLQRGGFEWQAARANAFHQVPFPFAALGENPVAAVRRWYDLRDELAGAGNSLFGTINRRHRTLEPDLLSVLSVVEGYHRARFDQLVVDEKEHKVAVEMMMDALPEHLVENYRKRLTYANEQTQRQRVRATIERAEPVVSQASGWTKLVHPLIETRNFLTHWGEKSDDVLEGEDLWVALKRVEIVLRINLMLDLKVDPVDIQGSVNISHGQHPALAD